MMGTKKLYDWVNDNPIIEMHPEHYVNDPWVIAQNYKVVSINSALQVDVLGQVAADALGPKQFSGVGGQIDFIRGAKRSIGGGKSIIAIPSTAAGGKVSRIVPALYEGTAVTTTRNEIDYVVTEYGIAKLSGKTNLERLKALVAISHPDFRDEIMFKAKEMQVGDTVSFTKTMTETDVIQWVGLTGDFNPIHIDREYAKTTRFGNVLVPGVLVLGLISKCMTDLTFGHVYASQNIKFTKPVYIGDTITATGTIVEKIEEKNLVKVETKCFNQKGELVMIGEGMEYILR